MVFLKRLFFLLFSLSISHAYAQDPHEYQWWAEAHNWDGITHWSRYIIRSPGYMGPNALPIPEINKAKVTDYVSINISGEYHKGEGEFAYNPYLRLNIPIAKNKVALDFTYRPFEYYETEELIRFERFGRNKELKGYTNGDLYIGTIVQLFDSTKIPFDATLRIVLKTTTGKDLANARHIDAPAYHFDVNLGKTIFQNLYFFDKISLYSMMGLYVWQADFDNNRQNDAYLYGLRSDFEIKSYMLSIAFSGYSGYMNLRDRPMAMRYTFEKKMGQVSLNFSYQKGLRDVISNSFRLGMNYDFKKSE